jgi:hypothetical protein
MTQISLERSQMLLLSGTANRALAEEVTQHLGQPLCELTIKRFADGEIFVKIVRTSGAGMCTSSSRPIRRREPHRAHASDGRGQAARAPRASRR